MMSLMRYIHTRVSHTYHRRHHSLVPTMMRSSYMNSVSPAVVVAKLLRRLSTYMMQHSFKWAWDWQLQQTGKGRWFCKS